HPVGTQIETVVGVQVAEVDSIYRIDVGEALERPERPVSHVEQESVSLCLDEVAGGRDVGAGDATGVPDDGAWHVVVAFSMGRGVRRPLSPVRRSVERVRMAAGSADVP